MDIGIINIKLNVLNFYHVTSNSFYDFVKFQLLKFIYTAFHQLLFHLPFASSIGTHLSPLFEIYQARQYSSSAQVFASFFPSQVSIIFLWLLASTPSSNGPWEKLYKQIQWRRWNEETNPQLIHLWSLINNTHFFFFLYIIINWARARQRDFGVFFWFSL